MAEPGMVLYHPVQVEPERFDAVLGDRANKTLRIGVGTGVHVERLVLRRVHRIRYCQTEGLLSIPWHSRLNTPSSHTRTLAPWSRSPGRTAVSRWSASSSPLATSRPPSRSWRS